MKSNLTIIALAAMLSTGVVASAQDYDDIYYDASKEAKVEKPRVVVTESYDYSNGYSNTDVTTYQYDNSYVAAEIVNGRDVQPARQLRRVLRDRKRHHDHHNDDSNYYHNHYCA